MKNYSAKVIVKSKPTVRDINSLNLQQAIEKLMNIENLSCVTGSFYILNFSAKNQCEALHIVEKISMELLANQTIETYEIKTLEEI